VDQGRLEDAEKISLRVLKGYEKVHGMEAVEKHIPALNTAQHLVNLFEQTGRMNVFELSVLCISDKI
jgi:hypothetical protein